MKKIIKVFICIVLTIVLVEQYYEEGKSLEYILMYASLYFALYICVSWIEIKTTKIIELLEEIKGE